MAKAKMAATAAKSKTQEQTDTLWRAWRAAEQVATTLTLKVRAANKEAGDRPKVAVGKYMKVSLAGRIQDDYLAESHDGIDLGVAFLEQFVEGQNVDWSKVAAKAHADLSKAMAAWERRRTAAGIPVLAVTLGEALGAVGQARHRIVEDPRRDLVAIAAKLHLAWLLSHFSIGRQAPERCMAAALESMLPSLPKAMGKAIRSDLQKREAGL